MSQRRVGAKRIETGGESIRIVPGMTTMQREPRTGGMQLTADFGADALGAASHKDHGRHCLLIHEGQGLLNREGVIIRCQRVIRPCFEALATSHLRFQNFRIMPKTSILPHHSRRTATGR